MSDVSKFGPLGEGEESRPLKVDLTRIDIRRGTLNLPRRFYDAFPGGEIEANDVVVGRKITVTFVPPRELAGLAPFFEEHDLQPNDAVSIAVAGGLQLTPIRRERRQGAAASAGPAAASREQVDRYQPAADEPVRQYVRERVRLETRQLGREPVSDEQASPEQEQTRVRLKAQQPSAYLAPPVPETKGGWQDVLHDPAPRRGQMVRPSERAVVRPDDLPSQGNVSERREAQAERSDPRQQRLFGEETERYGTVREAPRQESRPAGSVGNEPLALRQEAAARPERTRDSEPETRERYTKPQPEPRERDSKPQPEPRAAQKEREARAGSAPRQDRFAKPESDARRHDRFAKPESEATEAREPVLVGAASAEADVAGRISRYLQDPGTPAIVRAAAVAEELRLPLEAVQRGLAEASRRSAGAVSAIRPDVYLVKRSR